MDFGLAREFSADASALTATGALIGTPAYMAPEQVRGEVVGPAADIYSLGVIIFEMITGKRPFETRGLDVLTDILHARPPEVVELMPSVSSELNDLVASMLLKEPKSRPSSMKKVARALKGACVEKGSERPKPRRTESNKQLPDATLSHKRPKRTNYRLFVWLLIWTTSFAAIGVSLLRTGSGDPPRTSASLRGMVGWHGKWRINGAGFGSDSEIEFLASGQVKVCNDPSESQVATYRFEVVKKSSTPEAKFPQPDYEIQIKIQAPGKIFDADQSFPNYLATLGSDTAELFDGELWTLTSYDETTCHIQRRIHSERYGEFQIAELALVREESVFGTQMLEFWVPKILGDWELGPLHKQSYTPDGWLFDFHREAETDRWQYFRYRYSVREADGRDFVLLIWQKDGQPAKLVRQHLVRLGVGEDGQANVLESTRQELRQREEVYTELVEDGDVKRPVSRTRTVTYPATVRFWETISPTEPPLSAEPIKEDK